MKLTKHLRSILGALVLLNLVLAACILYVQHKNIENIKTDATEKKQQKAVWMTEREIPSQVDLGAYLVAFSALQGYFLHSFCIVNSISIFR
jgi:hypothetical protein